MLNPIKQRLFPFFKKIDPRSLVLGGNLLEFFDLYLYIHLATIINEKFFPGWDTLFLKMLSFSTLYLIAPLGCIAFSYIGDMYGRKVILIGTSFAMAISSFCVLFLPDHEAIGSYAGYSLLFLRIIQGLSLAGEPTAAGLYITELTPNERHFPMINTMLTIMECLGGAIALGLAYIGMNWLSDISWGWRLPFIATSIFVVVSILMRWFLEETPEYTEAIKGKQKISMSNAKAISNFYNTLEFKNRNVVCYFFLKLSYPVLFVLCYTYLSPMVLESLGKPKSDILEYNLLLSLGEGATILLIGLLVVWGNYIVETVNKITIARYLLGMCFIGMFCYVFENCPSYYPLLGLQILIMGFCSCILINPYIIKSFPPIGRFTYMGMGWAFARITNFVMITFVLDFLNRFFGYIGMFVLAILLMVFAIIAICLYIPYNRLEQESLLKTWKNSIPIKYIEN